MAQVKINNHTSCEYQILFANDENFRPVVTPVIKATFDIFPTGQLAFSKSQVPVNLEGEFFADPESSSYRYEPECAFMKPATDVVIIGDAVSGKGPVKHLLVEIQVGPLQKKIGVIGNRHWIKQAIGYVSSAAEPFERMSLSYENAYGGWDRRHEHPNLQGFEPRNTVGKGYYRTDVDDTGVPLLLPNIENPDALIKHIGDQPQPTGCGFTLPHWTPRSFYAGTYDQAWTENRSPLLPADFNRKFFNAASPGLIAEDYLTGKEKVVLKNMTTEGYLAFDLPGARPPVCEIESKDGVTLLQTKLDTVIINVPDRQLHLIWRNYLVLRSGPHDLESLDIHYG